MIKYYFKKLILTVFAIFFILFYNVKKNKDISKLNLERICVISLSGMGNTLMITPLLKNLKALFPNSQIEVIVTNEGSKQVLEYNKNITKIIRIRQGLRGLSDVSKLERSYDLLIDTMPNGLINGLASRKIKAKVSLGYNYKFGFIKTGYGFTNSIEYKHQHDVLANLGLIKEFGNVKEYDLEYYLNKNLSKDKVLGIHPGCNKSQSWKRWNKFAELCNLINEKYKVKTLIFVGPDEKEIGEKINQEVKDSILIKDLSIRETANKIANCKLFISNDSGLMHLATACRVPTIGLFGATDVERTRPWGKNTYVVKSNRMQEYDVSKQQNVKKAKEAMDTIKVDDVLNLIKDERLL